MIYPVDNILEQGCAVMINVKLHFVYFQEIKPNGHFLKIISEYVYGLHFLDFFASLFS